MDWDALIRDEVKPMVPYAPGLRASDVREVAGIATVTKLSSNENPYGPVPSAIAAMTAVLPYLNRYPDGAARALRGKLSEHLGVAEERVVVSNGSNELLRVIGEAVLSAGDETVFAWPSFVVYPMVTQLTGATAVRVALDASETHDLEAMAAAISPRTKIVFVCNPNNPTGTIVTREAFERFLSAVPENVLIVLDEAYFEYATDSGHVNALEYIDDPRVVVLRTFSKMYSLAGARCGYGVLPEALVKAVHKVRDPFNVNMVAQIGAYHALDDQAEVARRRAENASERSRVCAELSALGFEWAPSQANFVWMHAADAAGLHQGLIERGVIVRYFGGDSIRLGIGTPAENDHMIAALRDLVRQDA